MLKNNKRKVKILGSFFIAAGSLQLISGARDIWCSLEMWLRPSSFMTIQEYLFFTAISLLFLLVLPVAVLMAGYGMVRIRRWGWVLAVIACVVRFLFSLYGTINFAIASYESRNVPIPKIPEGAHVEFASMWPTYIYALSSTLLILLLTRNSVRKAFNY
jgi:hypothetical protein